jgi:hypothetical protein
MKPLYTTMVLGTVLGLTAMTGHTDPAAKGETTGTEVNTLLKRGLEVAKGADVIIDRVTLPPNSTLSRRWHPGEMFAYVIKGSVVVTPDDKDEMVGNPGDVIDVPLKQVYAAHTNSDGAQLLLFRVHESGKPIRTKME